MKLSPVKCG